MEKLIVTVFGGNQDHLPSDLMNIASAIHHEPYDEEKLLNELDPVPDVIICWPPTGGMSTLEIAQTLRMNNAKAPIFFLTLEKKDFDKKKLIKNGFTQAYLLPWEKSDFLRSMREQAIYSNIPELKDYRPIKVVDLVPGLVLDFSLKIYLPVNGKLIPFCHAGLPVSDEKFSKLKEGNFNTLFIHKDEIEKFKEYSSEAFKRLLRPSEVSETEKQERLDNCVRELISDMFIEDTRENTFGKSQGLLKEIKEVIKDLIVANDPDLGRKLDQLVNQEHSFYGHLTNVSTYSALFSMALGFDNPQNMALAGLLHDLGKINLPIEISNLEEGQMGKHAKDAYHKHPNYTLDVTRLKKIVLSDDIMKAILHHHERMNGTGYPSGLEGHRISKEGRLLAIADTFDYLTTMRPGEKSLSAREALLKMHDDNANDPGNMILDLDMLKKLKAFFIK